MCSKLAALVVLILATWPGPAIAGELLEESVVAEIRAARHIVQVGRPVWIDFIVRNISDEPVVVEVPGAERDEQPPAAMGLPLEHVFSGPRFRALKIVQGEKTELGDGVMRPPVGKVPAISIAPNASVGIRLDVTRFYSVLRGAGEYKLQWRPYGGRLVSNTLVITIKPLQRAVVDTDLGKMVIEFYYEAAPNHVANFIELAESHFYDGLTFWRVVRGILIQGGDPRGDGTGVRRDGKTLKAEFNNIPHELGTVSMARKPGDPDSASCQFFICLTRLREFDRKFTVFGKVVGAESIKTLKAIGSVETDANDRPVKPVYIRSIMIEDVPRQAGYLTAPTEPRQAR